MDVAGCGVGANQAEGSRADFRQGEAGQIELCRGGRRGGGTHIESSGPADGGVAREGDLLKDVDLPVDRRGVGEHAHGGAGAGAADVELLLSEVGGVGGGESADVERAGAGEGDHATGQRAQ